MQYHNSAALFSFFFVVFFFFHFPNIERTKIFAENWRVFKREKWMWKRRKNKYMLLYIMPIWKEEVETREREERTGEAYSPPKTIDGALWIEHKCKVAAASTTASVIATKILAKEPVHVYKNICVLFVYNKWWICTKQIDSGEKEWSSNEQAENGKSLWLLIVVPPLELKIKY